MFITHVNNDGILYFTGIGVECSGALRYVAIICVKENGVSKFYV
jgi:hypothetical protein